jgi:magnesium transporter
MQEVIVMSPSSRVSDVIAAAKDRPRPGEYIAVCEQGFLSGVVSFLSLVTASPDTTLATLATPAAAVVEATESSERAAWLVAHARAGFSAVVDESGGFLGLIPASRLLEIVVHEHEIDLARLGGFLRGTRRARVAGEEPVFRRVWHRVPWLLLGLLGAVLAAEIVSSFQGELEQTVALAFFLPGIVYMADAVGTQTETLVIRGFSVGVSQSRILRLEAHTGAVIGVLLSLAIFPLAVLVTGETRIALVVSLALMASASTASRFATGVHAASRTGPGVWLWTAGHRRAGHTLDRYLLRDRCPDPRLTIRDVQSKKGRASLLQPAKKTRSQGKTRGASARGVTIRLSSTISILRTSRSSTNSPE